MGAAAYKFFRTLSDHVFKPPDPLLNLVAMTILVATYTYTCHAQPQCDPATAAPSSQPTSWPTSTSGTWDAGNDGQLQNTATLVIVTSGVPLRSASSPVQ